MGLCGCFPECTCQLNVAPPDLLTLSGNGDPVTGGWLITAAETVFSSSYSGGGISVSSGGAYGHSPLFDLIIDDSDSVDLTVHPVNGLSADVRIDPSSTAPVSVSPAGVKIDCCAGGGAGGLIPIGAGMDFEGFVLPSGWLWEDGNAVSRSVYSLLFAAITSTQSGTRNGTTTITGLTSTKSIRVGCPLEGTGIPAGATVASILSATSLTISIAALSSGTDPITFFPHGNGNGSTTFNVPDARGRVSVGMDDLGNTGDAGLLDPVIFGLGHEVGDSMVSLTPAQTPLRNHTHGTTTTESINHYHSGTTATEIVNHVHGVPGGSFSVVNGANIVVPSGAFYTLTGQSINTYSQYTSGQNVLHAHNYVTSAQDTLHTHTVLGPSVPEANGDGHSNMQPSRLVNRIVYTGV